MHNRPGFWSSKPDANAYDASHQASNSWVKAMNIGTSLSLWAAALRAENIVAGTVVAATVRGDLKSIEDGNFGKGSPGFALLVTAFEPWWWQSLVNIMPCRIVHADTSSNSHYRLLDSGLAFLGNAGCQEFLLLSYGFQQLLLTYTFLIESCRQRSPEE